MNRRSGRKGLNASPAGKEAERLFGKKGKKKKKLPTEKFESLSANGVAVTAINFTLAKDADGSPRLEVRTPDVCEALHYEEIGFELRTNLKLIKVKGRFREAISEKHFKTYIFDVEDYEQFFI